MRKYFIFLFSLTFFYQVNAQWYDPEKVHHKANTIYNLAINKAQNDEYETALKMIQEALKIDPRFVDAYLSSAGIYANMKDYNASVTNFEKAFDLDAQYSSYYLLPYSISLAGGGRFSDALKAVESFLAIPNLNERSRKAGEFRKKTYQFAVDYDKKLAQSKYVFAPRNMGDSINTTHLEYFPSLTIDGKKLIFTKRIGSNEDFYESNFEDGSWSMAVPLSGSINTPHYNEGAQNISQDGKWLIFTGCNFPNGLGSCDLYISFLTKNGWSEPQNMGRNINSEFWESTPSLSPDKRDLYFSSNVPGGFGGKDIWVSHRGDDGKWSIPYNLGPEINTAGDESTPFIHADNQTLYFNSTGHPGYSEKPDLYVTRKLPDGKWSTPVNLGYPINTIDDEGSLVVAADGKTAYYSSDRMDTRGGLDIYTFELREDIRPLKTLWVKGRIYDAETKAGLPSTIELTDVDTRMVISKLQSDEDGNYLVTIPAEREYAFNVNRKGYLLYSENYQISGDQDGSFTADIPLQPIRSKAKVVLKNVFFNTNETALKPASIVELDNVVRLLQENPGVQILITGHTDNTGTASANQVLSEGRALSVVNYLISKGVDKARLSHKGFGSSNPVASNDTPEGRAQNRRTELEVK